MGLGNQPFPQWPKKRGEGENRGTVDDSNTAFIPKQKQYQGLQHQRRVSVHQNNPLVNIPFFSGYENSKDVCWKNQILSWWCMEVISVDAYLNIFLVVSFSSLLPLFQSYLEEGNDADKKISRQEANKTKKMLSFRQLISATECTCKRVKKSTQ